MSYRSRLQAAAELVAASRTISIPEAAALIVATAPELSAEADKNIPLSPKEALRHLRRLLALVPEPEGRAAWYIAALALAPVARKPAATAVSTAASSAAAAPRVRKKARKSTGAARPEQPLAKRHAGSSGAGASSAAAAPPTEAVRVVAPLPPAAQQQLPSPPTWASSGSSSMIDEGHDPLPRLVRGALAAWPALRKWQELAYFGRPRELRGLGVQVQSSDSNRFSGDGGSGSSSALRVTWGSFTDSLAGEVSALDGLRAQGLSFYLAQEPLLHGPRAEHPPPPPPPPPPLRAAAPTLAHLNGDWSPPAFVPWASAGHAANLWLCGEHEGEGKREGEAASASASASAAAAAASGPVSALHYDAYHNLLCVVRGAKTVRLYPPSATAALAPGALWGAAPHHATFDPEAPPEGQGQGPNDGYRSERERLRQQGYRATLARGDCLFIPEGWWHQVSSEPGTAAVNLWWLSAHALASRPPPAAAAADSAAADGVEGGDGGGSGSGVQVLWARLALRRLIEERTDEFVRAFVQERRVRAAAAHPEVSQITNSPKWLATRLHACPSSDEGVGAAAAEMAAASATELRAVLVSWAALAAGGEQNAEAFRKWWSVFVTCDSAEEGDTLTICGREESVQISAHCAARALEADPAPREGEGKEQRHRRGVAELGQLSDALGEGWSCPRFSSATIWAERLQERAQSLPRRAARELSDELLRGAGPGEVSAFQ